MSAWRCAELVLKRTDRVEEITRTIDDRGAAEQAEHLESEQDRGIVRFEDGLQEQRREQDPREHEELEGDRGNVAADEEDGGGHDAELRAGGWGVGGVG